MLERIKHIKGVGLLHEASGDNFKFDKATLIYADNGRGKTTLASILRSISTGNTTLITDRKTIDGVLPQSITLQFGSGHKVNFDNNTWSEKRPELIVFDSDFIDKNVHSGGSVNTEHRKNLLEFVLGESAVAAQVEVEKATLSSKVAKEDLEKIIATLSGHHFGKTLLEFENLEKIEDVEAKIIEQNTRITEAKNAASILSKPSPQVIFEPTLDIEGLFSTLAFSLPNIHADAENTVRQHILTLGGKSPEIWLSQGQQFNNQDTCPYCGQDTAESNLIQAYQTHFNASYNELKNKVTSTFNNISNNTTNIVENFVRALQIASAQALAWNEHIEIKPIIFEVEIISTALTQLRELLINLLNKKISSPAELIGTEEEKREALALWSQITSQMQQVNLQIKSIIESITTYKTKLTSYDITTLDLDLKLLQLARIRHETTVSELFSQLTLARNKLTQEEKSKDVARTKLQKSMKTTLEKYQESINKLLKKFGAPFTIENMKTNFLGKAPRSDYMLSLRGKNVVVEGKPPSFATALSDGDKRTLAFAFFVASTLADPDLSRKIVVIDDPMCSLDLNRKQHTQNVLHEIYSKAEQLIILAHDKHFIYGLKKTLHNKEKDLKIKEYQLTATENNYTNFARLDIDKECESLYFRHHRLLTDFINGNNQDVISVSKAIRPLLEGYLHRRFPGLLSKKDLFGHLVGNIKSSSQSSPLFYAKNLVTELDEINTYVGKFHHDNDLSVNDEVPVETELKDYAKRALNLIHRGHAS